MILAGCSLIRPENTSPPLAALRSGVTKGNQIEDETICLGKSDEEDDCGSAVGQGEGEDGRKTPRTRDEKEMDELSKRLHEVELFEGKKGKGALCVSLLKPDSTLARASTHVSWEGYPQEQTWRIHKIERKTVIGVPHGSFELYHRKKFTQKRQVKHEMDMYPDEYFVFFDIESDPQLWSGMLVSYNDLPALPGSKILRRLDELYRETSQVGWNPWHDMADLRESTGELTAMALAGTKFVQPQPTAHLVVDLYSLLNRRQCIVIWNFFRQMVINRELARRLASYDVDGPVMGFTTKILASLIIADRWFQNVQIRLADMGVDPLSIPKTVSSLQKDKAENFKRQGNEATRKKQHQLALDLYTEAIKVNLGNAVYRNNRSGALYDLGRYPEALDDALVATKLDPTYAKAWARLGLAHLRLGRAKRAKEALQRAIELAGRNATDAMRKAAM
ncbi:tetratricopeptide repeat protein [Aspergillus thermomutatus]|uniref:Uncharacterized protein n=1 Tax=Aspergillus thermomutatus TaxID=41047 RepID=A0A397G3F4_ASPTH|nr:uncharacterized protein CDV56_102366 [Aspergillus thermomutatus]RHZ45157.1 hypothetical protein CDV56_102366 [Aspergillus thermomutatus]